MLRWLVTDRTTGRIVIGQWPNLPLWTWLVATGVHAITGAGWLAWVATAALVVWAGLEVWKGASPFRRALGAAVLVVTALRLLL